ncbi:MAG: pilus assembly protein TadG-related protein [Planctomycetota bacterium]|nr:pilus assembly protein TadG-related protein [Planctomycetota bacterium]
MSTYPGFIRDESGQALVIGAISMLFILPMVALVHNVAVLKNKKLQLQEAADSAAYSAALVEANTLSSIALANEAIAYSYYGAMRHSVDVVVSGVLSEFAMRGAPPEVVGVVDAEKEYDESYDAAGTWIPRAERWMKKLSEMTLGMAHVTRELLSEEIARTAGENGVEAAAFFPTPEFIPAQVYRIVYYIERLEKGWRITNDRGYLLQFIEEEEDKWEITESATGTIIFEKIDATHWLISRGHWKANLETDGATFLNIEITDEATGSVTLVEARQVFGSSWEFSLESAELRLHVLPYNDGSFLIEVDSEEVDYSERVRWDENNRLMVLRGGAYEYLPDQEETIEVGGETVDVEYFRQLSFPGGRFVPPSLVQFQGIAFSPPNRLSLPGVQVGIDAGGVTLFGAHRHVSYRIRTDVSFHISGLTLKDGDGRWRIIDERRRHRIVRDSPRHWTYELVRDPSDLLHESPVRLGYHAVMENDPTARVEDGAAILPGWTKWFRIDAGESESGESYYQTRPVWDIGQRGVDYDGDGIDEVRIYQYQVSGRSNPPYQSVTLPRPGPLKISEAFWKYGLNVGVWTRGPKPVFSQSGNEKNSFFPFFQRSESGLFAVASARVGFRYRSMVGNIPEQKMNYYFSSEEAKRWSHIGYQCLYEPMWSARLVSVSDNIRDHDVDETGLDFGLPFFFRMMKRDKWQNVSDVEAFGRGEATERRDVRRKLRYLRNQEGRLLDMENPALKGILQH